MLLPVTFLFVEENPENVNYLKQVFREYKFNNELIFFNNTVTAREYLLNEPPYEHTTAPDMIFMNQKLVTDDTTGLWSLISGDENFKKIPLIIIRGKDSQIE